MMVRDGVEVFCFWMCALTASHLLSHDLQLGSQKDARDCWKPSDALGQQEGANEVPQITHIPNFTASRRTGIIS